MRQVWAIADIHLSISCPEKTMEVFGDRWTNYQQRLMKNWQLQVQDHDIVLIAGDISWAMKPEKALLDLEWLSKLPGIKVMIKGNHDYWWRSRARVQAMLPEDFHIIQNDAIDFEGLSIGGTRLWDSLEYSFRDLVNFKENPKANPKVKPLSEEENEKIFAKELQRLEMSLQQLNQEAPFKIAMTHYPPIGNDLKPSKVHELLKKYHVDLCVFGHLHNVECSKISFGQLDGIEYTFVAADFLQFQLKKLK